MPPAAKAPLTQDALLARRCARALAAHRRRAKAEGKALDYEAADLERLAREATTCAYCRMPMSFASLAFDHATPTARRGDFALRNVRACCRHCNERKGALHEDEFRALLTWLNALSPASAEDVRRRLRAGGKVYRRGRG